MPTLQDLYPSRCQDHPQELERKDPVVYGSADDGPLNQAELTSYERNGFLFLPRLFAESEVAVFNAELRRLSEGQDVCRREEAITEPGGGALRSLFRVQAFSRIFEILSRDCRVLDRVRQLLGGDVYLTQSRINMKPGFQGREFFWHSDFETWHVEDGMPRMRAVSCSILLTDNNEFNGPLMLMPGSHRRFIACIGDTPENHYRQSLKKQELGVPDPASIARLVETSGLVAPKGPAGSVLLFECNTLHGSAGNISPWPRSNVFFVYNSVDNALVEPFGAPEPRPDFLAWRGPVEPLSPVRVDYERLAEEAG